MGQLTVLLASTSGGGLIALLIILGLVFVDYWATMRIITKAGYSSKWILLPLAPLILTIVYYVILWHDLREIYFGSSIGFGGFSNTKFFWGLDVFSIFLNWLFYVIFAFSRWPSTVAPRQSDDPPLPPTPTRAISGSPSKPPAPAAPVPTERAVPPSGAGPGAGPGGASVAPALKRPSAQFCAWCGEPLPGNRALFHNCGSKDRPETNCKTCGTALPAGSTECSSCGAA
jgi:hypothetical protein